MAGKDTPAAGGRFDQVRTVFAFTRERDPRLLPLLVAPAVAIVAVLLGIGFAVGRPVYLGVFGVLVALLWVTSTFSRRSMAAQYASVEGQPGAAAAVLQGMRGDWRVQPAVAVNRNQDLVHRVAGRAGVVLVGEGSPARVAQLMAQEKRRVVRVAAEVPVYEVLVGDGDGQVPLRKLQRHLVRLPRNLRAAQVDGVESRLRALGGPSMPIPKGPLPRGARMPRGRAR